MAGPGTSFEYVIQASGDFPKAAVSALLLPLGSADSACLSTASVLRIPAVERPGAVLRDAIDELCETFALDRAWLPFGKCISDFGLIAFDMDSTLITGECIDDLAACMGYKDEVAAMTVAAMHDKRIDYDTSLRSRVALLRGLSMEQMASTYAQHVCFSPGAREVVSQARQAGLKTALISGGFDYFAQRVGVELGIDFVFSNYLEMDQGRATGQMFGTLINAAVKAQTLQSLCACLGIAPSQAIAVGDGANDLQMMAIAGLSVGYRPKPAVREQVDVLIRAGSLASLLGFLHPSPAGST